MWTNPQETPALFTFTKDILNPFVLSGPFLYPLKTLHFRFSDRVHWKSALETNGLIENFIFFAAEVYKFTKEDLVMVVLL